MTKQLDLLLVSPGGRSEIYQHLADDLTAIEPPVWCGLIAEFIRRKGFTVQILDANADGLDSAEAGQAIADRHARFVAITVYGQNPSASTQTMPEALRISYAVKAFDEGSKVVMLGGHVAALPDRTLKESGADYVCTGEGCYSLLDLLSGKNEHDCRGIGFMGTSPMSARTYFETVSAPNVTDVNVDMPTMAVDLLPSMGKYRCHSWHGWTAPEPGLYSSKPRMCRLPYAAIYTSLGCPYRCSFCCIAAPFKEGDRVALRLAGKQIPDEVPNSYRLWNPENVGDLLANLHYNHGVGNIKIADEMFVLNKQHVEGTCDVIQALIRNPADSLNIWAYARVDTANDLALLEKMRRAGFRWLALGIESASSKVRNGVDKSYAQEKIVACVNRIKAAGIHVLANYIFGLPDDDYESMSETYKLACEINAPWANFYSALPYPGSQLWRETPSHHTAQWSTFSQHSYDCKPMATKHLTSTEVLNFRDQAFEAYYTNERYLSSIAREFGDGARAEVEAMTGRRLSRQLLEESDVPSRHTPGAGQGG